MRLTRRELGGVAAGSLAGLMLPRTTEAAGPLSDMPAGAIDVHNHIVGPLPKYPMAPNRTYTPPEASVGQLHALRTQLGVARNVLVQPSFYGFDNSCLVDALAELGTSARGVAVVPVDVTDTELKRLASRGVTGVRLNLSTFGIRDPKVAADAGTPAPRASFRSAAHPDHTELPYRRPGTADRRHQGAAGLRSHRKCGRGIGRQSEGLWRPRRSR